MDKINLTKGDKINLSKSAPSLKKVRVGLGWVVPSRSKYEYDLDVSAFGLKMVDGNPVLVDSRWFVFYNNTVAPDKAIIHTGDSRSGAEDEENDAESIVVNLPKLPDELEEISFIVTIHDAENRGQSFGQVKASYIAIYDDLTDKLIARYDIKETFANETALQFGSLFMNDNEWSFKAIGAGYNLPLSEFVVGYGGDC